MLGFQVAAKGSVDNRVILLTGKSTSGAPHSLGIPPDCRDHDLLGSIHSPPKNRASLLRAAVPPDTAILRQDWNNGPLYRQQTHPAYGGTHVPRGHRRRTRDLANKRNGVGIPTVRPSGLLYWRSNARVLFTVPSTVAARSISHQHKVILGVAQASGHHSHPCRMLG